MFCETEIVTTSSVSSTSTGARNFQPNAGHIAGVIVAVLLIIAIAMVVVSDCCQYIFDYSRRCL